MTTIFVNEELGIGATLKTERMRFAKDRCNRFVMLIVGEIAAIGMIDGFELKSFYFISCK
ncbi:hypothetical protein [Paenibacillus sp. Marseille-Q9583]